MLQEKVSRNSDRVDVAKFHQDMDLSGGYLLAYENDNSDYHQNHDSDTLLATRLLKLTILKEYTGDTNDVIVTWMQRWMYDFEANLLSLPVANPTTWLDVPAAIDYFIITEVAKNPDGYRGSVKMHKDRGGPFGDGTHLGPQRGIQTLLRLPS